MIITFTKVRVDFNHQYKKFSYSYIFNNDLFTSPPMFLYSLKHIGTYTLWISMNSVSQCYEDSLSIFQFSVRYYCFSYYVFFLESRNYHEYKFI